MDIRNLIFYYKGNAVGAFSRISLPISKGKYPFDVFRGLGSLDLLRALEKGGPQSCYYKYKRREHFFTVISISLPDGDFVEVEKEDRFLYENPN